MAHAGEEGPPAYIWEALDDLHVSRIDHGVRCLEDPALVDHLRGSQVPLTVCPLSNVKLRVFERLEDHNLKQLLDAGLCATVNSDDPAYFGGYIEENFLGVQRALNLERTDLHRLARNAFEASFLAEDAKTKLLAELDDYVASGERFRNELSHGRPFTSEFHKSIVGLRRSSTPSRCARAVAFTSCSLPRMKVSNICSIAMSDFSTESGRQ